MRIPAIYPGHVEILFDRGSPKEAIFGGEITHETLYGREYRSVRFDFDGEVRYYDPYRLAILRIECQKRKKELGIKGKITGKLKIDKCACGNEFPVPKRYRGRTPEMPEMFEEEGWETKTQEEGWETKTQEKSEFSD